jgi:hypothetical protein
MVTNKNACKPQQPQGEQTEASMLGIASRQAQQSVLAARLAATMMVVSYPECESCDLVKRPLGRSLTDDLQQMSPSFYMKSSTAFAIRSYV